MGPSGSGKSTLLNLIAGLDRPTGGTVTVAGQRIDKLGESALARFRARHIGFIFQFFNLLDDLTVSDNVLLPAQLAGASRRRARARAAELLDRMGLADQRNAYPARLSGGQRQRVAIARALVNSPELLLADEPTGRARHRHRPADRPPAERAERGRPDAGPRHPRPGPRRPLRGPHHRDRGRPGRRRPGRPGSGRGAPVSGRAALAPRPQGTGARPGPDATQGGSWLGPVRTASGGMRRHKVATIVIAVVLFVATASATLGLALLAASNGPFTHAFSAQRGADVTVTANAARASNAELAATGHLAGVTALAGPFAEATAEVNFQGQPWGQLQLAGRPAPGGPVDDLVLNAGHWVDGPGQVVLNGYEGNGGIADGNTVQVTNAPGKPTLTVVGFANSITSTADGWVAPGQIAALRAPGTPADRAAALPVHRQAGSDAQIRADVAAITRALPAGTVASSASWLTAQFQAEGNGAIMEPFVLAFALIGLVMAVLIVGNVISGAVVAQYQRIGVLKSLGLTPAQVVAVYLNRVTWPALAGCLVGTAAGGLLSLSVLHQSAGAYGVGSQQLPWSALVIAPAAMFALTMIAALGPAVRAGRLSAIEAIAAGRAPRSGRGYAAHRLAARLRLPRPVGLGVAAPFARPARTLVTLAAVAFGATAVIFAVGLHASLSRAAAAQLLSGTVPVQIQQSGNGAGPNQAPTAVQLAGLAAMLRAQPGTAHEATLYGNQVTVPGISQQVQALAFDGPSAWTGYALIGGHWYDGPGQVDVNTSFLDASGLAIGDSTTVDTPAAEVTVRIVGEVFAPSRQARLYGATQTLPGLASGQNFWQVDVGLRPGDQRRRLHPGGERQVRRERRVLRDAAERRPVLRDRQRPDRLPGADGRDRGRARGAQHGADDHQGPGARPRRLQGAGHAPGADRHHGDLLDRGPRDRGRRDGGARRRRAQRRHRARHGRHRAHRHPGQLHPGVRPGSDWRCCRWRRWPSRSPGRCCPPPGPPAPARPPPCAPNDH